MVEPHSLQDMVMQARFREIVRDHRIKVIVETGIDKGLSTCTLAGMADRVISIDNQPKCLVEASSRLSDLGIRNALLVYGSSPTTLWGLRPFLPDETLYFLDAHWQDYWPLLDEIAAIRPGTGVIVLHDIQVPNHPELGCDQYKGQVLCYDYVRPALTQWSPTHRIEYNERAECQQPRGCGYVFPR